MGNTIKLVSGFILFIIGVILAYETTVYNLIDILLFVGLLISIVGIIIMTSYFADSNATRTTNMIKEFLESREKSSSSFRGLNKQFTKDDHPLRIQNELNESSNRDYHDFFVGEHDNYSNSEDYESSFEDDSKAVLNVVPQKDNYVDLDNELNFTPHYDKPLKVNRAPKRREADYFFNEVPEVIVEPTNNASDIQSALSYEEPDSEHFIKVPTDIKPEMPARDIKIDINNPESLPIPKSLNSFILSNSGVLTSQEAFDNLAITVNKEIMLEIPSLNDLSDRVLSHVPTIYSRVIINEFDVSDMSYMFLISSLLKQGVHIKTVPKVHTTNLITDDSYAMIISEGNNNMEYGAIYDDRNSISNIRANFEKTWNIASNLDDSILMNNASGGVV